MFIKINEKHRVIQQIADKYSEGMVPNNVTTFRVEGVEILPRTGDGEILCFDPITRFFYTEKIELTKEQREYMNARTSAIRQRDAALKWLADNDWKVNKRTLGEWAEDDERWIAYLADRAKARATIDNAEAVLKGGE